MLISSCNIFQSPIENYSLVRNTVEITVNKMLIHYQRMNFIYLFIFSQKWQLFVEREGKFVGASLLTVWCWATLGPKIKTFLKRI